MQETAEWSAELGQRTVTDASVLTFASLTGDYARMHLDLGFGPATGMGPSIAHGLLSAAWSLGALAQQAPDRLALDDPTRCLRRYEIRFARMVHQGDRFSLRYRATRPRPDDTGVPATGPESDFEILNQRGEVTCSGRVEIGRAEADAGGPVPLEIERWEASAIREPLGADEMLTRGPRGESLGRTVTEADLVNYTNFTGERDPLYLNQIFARQGPMARRIAPPMWTFCVGFGEYLRDLLSIPLPSSAMAGHLGDRWRSWKPVHVGDTLRTRHKPIAFKASQSRPQMGIVEFALQIVNQRDEVVQDGEVVMMMNRSGSR